MFERLFELFLHAKSGVFAGIFLIGTTGALVTATVQNGVTTITITEASPSPSASASASASPSATASPTASPTGSPTSPSSSPSSNLSECTSKFQAGVDATKQVNTAFSRFHTDLMHLRQGNGDAAEKTVENADKLLKQLRESAVKAIHSTTSCVKHDDEDKMDKHEDENDNEDADKNDEQKGEHEDGKTPHPSPTATRPAGTDTFTPVLSAPPTATTGTTSTDPKTIADNAVAAMQLVFDTAKAQLPAAAATPSRSPRPSRSPEPSHDGKDHD